MSDAAQTLLAQHTPPADVVAMADRAAIAAPFDTAAPGEVVEWATSSSFMRGTLSAFLHDFYGVVPGTPAQWARFGVVTGSLWFRGLDSTTRRRIAVAIVGDVGVEAYTNWMACALLAA